MQAQISIQKKIIAAGLLVGTLDISAAIIKTLINGGNPVRMFQFIASGVFGKAAFAGGAAFAAYGLLFHYCIAMCWTIFFFLVIAKWKITAENRVLTGIMYGVFIWGIMSRVILPLSSAPALKFKWMQAIIAMLILIAAIGLPLSFMAAKYYAATNRFKKEK